MGNRKTQRRRKRAHQKGLNTHRFEKAPKKKDNKIDIEKSANTISMGFKINTNPGIWPKGNTNGIRNL